MRPALLPVQPSAEGLQGPFIIQTQDYVKNQPKMLMLDDDEVLEIQEQILIIKRSYGVAIYQVTGWTIEGLCLSAQLVAFAPNKETADVEP